ncbi:hypothetical protein PSU4_25300 [Pseudonocardia sulfidoxydans NBRC 16205]|uniref:Uncharacterized protein n=1 Tax=Pseudonocardia sulfidoxydans NBRC 16205 TaxID=1223511 RepID=A0A511DFK9_9PSEU|nr:hypothetical protein PSU4_25300 [Pseudonocardia sulfidoxydans NBRC 16205]
MSWLVVAEYSLTGTLTSPNETAPLHIARMVLLYPAFPVCRPVRADPPRTAQRDDFW